MTVTATAYMVLFILSAGPEGRSAKDALSSHEYPWYDASTDAYRWIPLSQLPKVTEPTEDDDSSTEPSPSNASGGRKPSANKGGQPTTDGKGRGGRPRPEREQEEPPPTISLPIGDGLGFFTVLLWILFGGLAAYLLYLLLTYLRDRSAEDDPTTESVTATTPSNRVEALPDAVRRVGDFLAEAERCVTANDIEQAAVYYFAYQLLALDRGGRIELAKGKTNRRYLKELASNDGELLDTVHQTSRLFERALYGKLKLSRERFTEVWQQRSVFRAMMEGRSSQR